MKLKTAKASYFVRYRIGNNSTEHQWAFDLVITRGTCANYIIHQIIDEVKKQHTPKPADKDIQFLCISQLYSEYI